MPKTVYLFDVDGTLTDPLSEVDEVFADVFLSWVRDKGKKVYLVTGSDIKKTKKQLFSSFIDQCEGIFTCSGNVLYSKGMKVYENDLELPEGFIEDLKIYLEQGTQWRKKTGTHIEIIVAYIKELYPDFEVSIGGQISVDIYPVGKNKSQVVDNLEAFYGDDVKLIFTGDRNVAGGNDWPLAQRLDHRAGSEWFQVDGYEETRALIEHNELFR